MMPEHIPPIPHICIVSLLLLLAGLLLPMATLAQQGTVPVTVEVRFPEQPEPPSRVFSLGTASTAASERTSTLVVETIAKPPTQTISEKEATAQEKAAAPRLQLRPRPLTVGGFARYERVDFDTPGALDLDGNIYSFNAQLAWDIDSFSFGVLMPYDFLDLDSLDAHRIGAIAFGQYHWPLSTLATLHLTVNGTYTHTAINRGDLDDLNTFGGGASVALTLDKGRFVGSGILSYQFSADDSGSADNQQHLLKVGATAGIRLGRNAVVTLFGAWTYDATNYSEALRGIDRDYVDLGLELTWNLSPRWGLTGGYKKVVGLENFDSNQVFLGTLFRF